MGKSRRSKTAILVEEFADKIKTGAMTPGNDFFTMKALMARYRISIGTANKVLQELQALGLLEVQRGRKSKIANLLAQPPVLAKPVGVIAPVNEPFHQARWRDAILQEVQRRLFLHGNRSLLLPDDFDLRQAESNYSGFIYATERVNMERWQNLLTAQIPCARISFDRPYFNTVFSDYRPALDRLILHMAAARCKRTIYLAPSEEECARIESKLQLHGRATEIMNEYGIRQENRTRLVMIPNLYGDTTRLEEEIGKAGGKLALTLSCSAYIPMILRIMENHGRRIHVDYELYSFSFIENEIALGSRLDLKYPVMAGKLVDMFYRQCLSGEPQLGEILVADFIPDN